MLEVEHLAEHQQAQFDMRDKQREQQKQRLETTDAHSLLPPPADDTGKHAVVRPEPQLPPRQRPPQYSETSALAAAQGGAHHVAHGADHHRGYGAVPYTAPPGLAQPPRGRWSSTEAENDQGQGRWDSS